MADASLGLRTHDVIEIREIRARERSRTPLVTTLAAHPLTARIGVTSPSWFSTGAMLLANDAAVAYRFADPAFLGVLDIPIVGGRLFTEMEGRSAAPVVILSQSAAERL